MKVIWSILGATFHYGSASKFNDPNISISFSIPHSVIVILLAPLSDISRRINPRFSRSRTSSPSYATGTPSGSAIGKYSRPPALPDRDDAYALANIAVCLAVKPDRPRMTALSVTHFFHSRFVMISPSITIITIYGFCPVQPCTSIRFVQCGISTASSDGSITFRITFRLLTWPASCRSALSRAMCLLQDAPLPARKRGTAHPQDSYLSRGTAKSLYRNMNREYAACDGHT